MQDILELAARQGDEASLWLAPVRYKPQIDLPDQCCPLCFSYGQFVHGLFRGAVV
jgi:hypothetical protein